MILFLNLDDSPEDTFIITSIFYRHKVEGGAKGAVALRRGQHSSELQLVTYSSVSLES